MTDLYKLTEKIFLAYILTIAIFLILRLFSSRVKRRTDGFLNTANLLVLFGVFLSVSLAVINFLECRNRHLEVNDNIAMYDCKGVLIWPIVLGFLFQMCFLFGKVRVKIWASIVSAVMIFFLLYTERIIIAIAGMYRDYIPSKWSTIPEQWELPGKLAVFALFFACCWFASKPKLTREG